jgi:hypothetical protein
MDASIITGGVAAGVVLLVVLFFVWRRWRRPKQGQIIRIMQQPRVEAPPPSTSVIETGRDRALALEAEGDLEAAYEAWHSLVKKSPQNAECLEGEFRVIAHRPEDVRYHKTCHAIFDAEKAVAPAFLAEVTNDYFDRALPKPKLSAANRLRVGRHLAKAGQIDTADRLAMSILRPTKDANERVPAVALADFVLLVYDGFLRHPDPTKRSRAGEYRKLLETRFADTEAAAIAKRLRAPQR